MGRCRDDGASSSRGFFPWYLLTALSLTTILAACGGSGGALSSIGGGDNPPTVPTISTQPQAQAVTAGATATFAVTATGSAPLAYQWQKNGSAISGASASSYTTPATVSGDNGASFTVIVSNSAGQVTSSAAVLTVNGTSGPPPAITTQPQAQTVAEGATATFSVVATGAGPLTYQWQKNDVALVGATSASYTTPASIVADSGESFTVVVTGPTGRITSSAALLTVTPLHTGNADPEGVYYGSLTFSSQPTPVPLIAIVLKDGTALAFAIQGYATTEVPIGMGLTGIKVVPNGTSFSSTFTAHTQTGYVFQGNGQSSATGSMSGTVTPGVSITGTFSSTLDSGSFTLTSSPASYAPSSSIATIAGTYHHTYAVFTSAQTTYDATETIGSDGSGVGSDTANCSYTGTWSPPDPNHNAYNVTTSGTCNNTAQPAYHGLAAFFAANSATGTALNSALNGVSQALNTGVSSFATDTVVSIADNGQSSYLIFAHK